MGVGSPGLHLPLLRPEGAGPLHVRQAGPRVRQEIESGNLIIWLLRLEQETGAINHFTSLNLTFYVPSGEPNLWMK